jgi:hypothetical protein
MGIESYSTTPGDNTALAPENMLPSQLNNALRQVQADIAALNQDPGWYRLGAPVYATTYLAGNSFRVVGVDARATFHAGRRVRAIGAVTGAIYGTVSSSTYTGGNTDCVVTWSSGTLANEVLNVYAARPGGGGIFQSLPFASTTQSGTVELASASEWLTGTVAGAVVPSMEAIVDGWVEPIDETYWRGVMKFPLGFRVEFGAAAPAVARSYANAWNFKVALLVAPSHGSSSVYYATVTNETPSSFVPRVFNQSGTAVGIPVTYLAIGL